MLSEQDIEKWLEELGIYMLLLLRIVQTLPQSMSCYDLTPRVKDLIPRVMTSCPQGVLIGYELHRIAAGEETALQQILKDGIVCCRIVNCIIPNKIPKVRIIKYLLTYC